MGVTLKLANLWRVISEVDLQAIRTAALAPFELWLVDQGDGSADRLRTALGGDARLPHASLRIVPASDVASLGAQSALASVLPAAAIVIATDPAGASTLDAALAVLRRGRVPLVVVSVGESRVDDRVMTMTERHVKVPALDDGAVERIGAALVAVVPMDLRLALARRIPRLRSLVFDLTIDEAAKANASYALTTGLAEVVPVLTVPLNLGDMLVLTKNQLIMSYRLVLAAGRDGEPRALIGEILGVLGGGLLFRQLARQLVGLIPIAGVIPKIAIAYGGTWAIGRAIVLWATEGREVTSDLVRTLSSEGVLRGRSVAARLVEQARTRRGQATRRWQRLKEQLPFVGRRDRP